MKNAMRFSGAKIRQARHAKGLTQAELARIAGTRERNIIRWENDQHAPRLDNVLAIATATGQDIEFFVADAANGGDDDEDEETDLAADLARIVRLMVREEMAAAA